MSTVSTRIVISAKDTATGVFRKTGLQVESLKRKVFSLNSAMAGLGLGLGGREIYTQARDFETALTDMSKVTTRDLGLIRADIMSLPPELGNATELMRGYYQVISAGVTDPAKAMDMLVTSAKSANAAHTAQDDVVKALTKTMAGFGGEIKNATEASDLLFSIEKVGQTSFAELVPVMGDLSTLSHALGLNTSELGGALAHVTQTAGSTGQAATQYKAVLMGLYKPTEKMEKLLTKLGYESGKALVSDKGFVGALQAVKHGSEQTHVALGDLFESSEALIALNALFANSFTTLEHNIASVSDGVGGSSAAWDKWLTSAEAMENALKNQLGNALVELGTELLPVVKDGMADFTGWVTENKGEIKGWGQDVSTVLTSVGSGASDLLSIFHDMPEWMKEASGMGLIGGMLFGPKGAAVLAVLGVAVDNIKDISEELSMVATGEMSWWDHLTSPYGDSRAKGIKARRGTIEGLEEQRSRYVHKRKSSYYTEDQEFYDEKIAEVTRKIDDLKLKQEAQRLELASRQFANSAPLVKSPSKTDDGTDHPPIKKPLEGGGGGVFPSTHIPTSDPLALVQAKAEMRTFAAEQQVAMGALDRMYADGKVKLEEYYVARRLKAEESAALQKKVADAEYAHTIETLEKKAAAESDQEAKKLILNEMIKEELLYKTELFEIDQKRIGILATLADKEHKAHEEAAKKATAAWKDGAASMKSAGESVASTLGEAMGDMASGAEVSFDSMANSIISSLMRIYVTQQLVTGISGIMGNLFDGYTGTEEVATSPSLSTGSQVDAVASSLGSGIYYSPLNHSGGMVGQSFSAMRSVPASLFDGAPRYHSGGEILRPGEVPIIAEAGERMLTREQNAAYERMRNAPSAAPQINIHITNEDGTKSEVTNEESSFDGERWVCDMWMRGYKNNTNGMRDSLGGRR
ncbi:phage tail tape measure protein [Halodesulfovibrio aestuarii]|uniref:phage tail tape measure protein n=1 Tax=Halodesulfovibrio aestuarii TaxID=126333 RepID=UPI003D3554C4